MYTRLFCVSTYFFSQPFLKNFCACYMNIICIFSRMNGHCSHIVGLLKTLQGLKLHNFKQVPDQQSCTSMPQQWHIPRGAKIAPVPVNQVVIAKPLKNRKRRPVLCQFDKNERCVLLVNFDTFIWIEFL